MADETTTTAENTQATAKATENAAQATGDATGTNGGQQERTFTAERLEEIVKERLERDRQARAKEAEKEEEKRQKAELEKQGEFKKIADDLQVKVNELEPLTERVTKLEEKLSANLEAEIKDWPVEVKELDPGKDADLLARLEWVNKSRALAAKLAATPAVPGNGRGPKIASAAHVGQAAEAQRSEYQQRARTRYR